MDFTSVDGVINILKPPGMTSSNVVSDVRRLFGIKRVGHTGTLDPGAAGVLPICIGRATRLFDILVDKQKEYIAEVSFGKRTNTQDSYGETVETSDGDVSPDIISGVLQGFIGKQYQTAPAFSALKQNGHSLYELARSGADVPERIREIEIDSLQYIKQTGHNRFLIKVDCSRGTYVRTLCEDIGRRIGECAHMSFLLRTGAGMFHVDDSLSIYELSILKEQGRLMDAVIPVETVLDFLPIVKANCKDALLNGLTEQVIGLTPGEYYRVYADHFIGVGLALDDSIKLRLRF